MSAWNPPHCYAPNGEPISIELAEQMLKEPDARRIAEDIVVDHTGQESYVSTVFMPLDHNLSGHGRPVLWETMVFGGAHDGDQYRYTSRSEAERGHAATVAYVHGDV